MRSDHTYDPNVFCGACHQNFPRGSTGCHRHRLGVYDDDPSSKVNKKTGREKPPQETPDPYSGE